MMMMMMMMFPLEDCRWSVGVPRTITLCKHAVVEMLILRLLAYFLIMAGLQSHPTGFQSGCSEEADGERQAKRSRVSGRD